MDITTLSKEDLIKVIANMHDTIQTWNESWGFNKTEGDILNSVGNAAITHCSNANDFSLPIIK